MRRRVRGTDLRKEDRGMPILGIVAVTKPNTSRTAVAGVCQLLQTATAELHKAEEAVKKAGTGSRTRDWLRARGRGDTPGKSWRDWAEGSAFRLCCLCFL